MGKVQSLFQHYYARYIKREEVSNKDIKDITGILEKRF